MSYQSYAGEVIDAEYVEVIPAQRGMGSSLLSRHSRDPQGAAYYHGFVDAYAQGALDMIRRW